MIDIVVLSGLLYAVGKDVWSFYIQKEQYKERIKIVNFNYPADSGMQSKFEEKGYRVRWVTQINVENYKLQGYNILYERDDEKKVISTIECWNEQGNNNLVFMGKKEMKIYQLIPVESEIVNQRWQYSSYKGEMIIRAATESGARILAEHKTIKAIEMKYKMGSLESPWGDSRLVRCVVYGGTEYSNNGLEEILKP